MDQDPKRRLAKVMAARGVASRREAERMIEAGRVTVNGEVVSHPGHPVDPEHDHIRVDDKPLPAEPPKIYLLLYKPRGYITTRYDPEGRRSVLELLGDFATRVEPVGRLDFNTEGALLLTNDGALAHALTHPSRGVPKRYLAKVYRTPDQKDLERIAAGIWLEDGRTAPAKARVVETTDVGNAWIEVTVTEGRNRLVRRMLAALGHPVSRLKRESFATLSVRGMEPGDFRALEAEEILRLKEIAQGVHPAEAGRKGARKKEGFAQPDPKWLARRLDKRRRSDKRGRPPRGGAAR